jgi:miniconductance mechanosensitive channel
MELKYQAFVEFRDHLHDYWTASGFNNFFANILNLVILTTLTFFVGWLLKAITQKIFISTLERLIKKSKTEYDDFIIHRRVLHRASHLVPALVVYSLANVVFQGFPSLMSFAIDVSLLYILFVFLWSISASVNVLEDIYNTFPYAGERPIKGYIQVLHLVVWFIGILIAVSIIFDVKLMAVFASLGAVAAVLLLIFKDTILGLVAGIQLSANKMVKPGDWISMPSQNADGTVIEITLNTVKVQNGDKTITTIPTYTLVSNSFSNWKGIDETGGRRIKRFVNIDMTSVKFCTPEMLEHFKTLPLLSDYFSKRSGTDNPAYPESITNLEVFRKYLEAYLQTHPHIRKDLTLVVRHLQPTENGLPLEIYAFSDDPTLAGHENVQSDIFDHLLATISGFELRVFQAPSGHDFGHLNR